MISPIQVLRAFSATPNQPTPSKYQDFLRDVARDIGVINEKIAAFNKSTTDEDKFDLLNQIYILRQEMNNRYPLNYINYCLDYQRHIHIGLWGQLKKEFLALGITSLHERVLPKNRSVPVVPFSISDVFANMPPAQLRRFMWCCWEDPTGLEQEIDFICDFPGVDKNNLIQFFKKHRITVITAAGNSRNLKIEKQPADGSPPVVLKIDARLNSPKEVEQELKQKGFVHFAQVLGEERQSIMEVIVDLKPSTQAATLLLTEFLPHGDLRSQAEARHKLPDPNSGVLSSALHYYQQMATILLDLQQKGGAFPDAKNTNWLIDAHDKLRIADTKSLLFVTPPDILSLSDPKNKWLSFIFSKHLVPPDLVNASSKKLPISADALHTYMLGKNLYEYLTNCDLKLLLDYAPKTHPYYNILMKNGPKYSFNKDTDFNHPVFNIIGGPVLKELIQKMVQPDPAKRIPLQEALKTLNELSAWLADSQCQTLVKECSKLISEMNLKDLKDDSIMMAFMVSKKNELKFPINGLNLLKLKNELTALLQKMDEVSHFSAEDKLAYKKTAIPDRVNFQAKVLPSNDTARLTVNLKNKLKDTIGSNIGGKPTRPGVQ